jgi:hypothetical protein
MVRVGIAHYNTTGEVERLLAVVSNLARRSGIYRFLSRLSCFQDVSNSLSRQESCPQIFLINGLCQAKYDAGCRFPGPLRLSLIALARIQRAQRAQNRPFFAWQTNLLGQRDGGL